MSKKYRLGVYGGSFNPIHKGHIELARLFMDRLNFDKLLLIPTAIPPHKVCENMASGTDRFNMCSLASKNIEGIEVSDIEINRQGKSYTIDTLKSICEIYQNFEIYLLMGADMFLCFDTWKEYKEILKIAVLCTVPRNNDNVEILKKYADYLNSQGGKTIVLEQMLTQVSSTQIRDMLKLNKDVDNLLSKEVFQYIKDKHLYNTF